VIGRCHIAESVRADEEVRRHPLCALHGRNTAWCQQEHGPREVFVCFDGIEAGTFDPPADEWAPELPR